MMVCSPDRTEAELCACAPARADARRRAVDAIFIVIDLCGWARSCCVGKRRVKVHNIDRHVLILDPLRRWAIDRAVD